MSKTIRLYSLSSTLTTGYKVASDSHVFLNELKKCSGNEFVFVDGENKTLKEEADLELIFVQSGGSEQFFLQHFAEFSSPYLILSYEANNSLAASMEILSYCHSKGYSGEILYGSFSYLVSRIEELLQLFKAKKSLKTSKLGVIGKPSDWLISSQIDYNDCEKIFGIKIVDISLDEVITNFSNVKNIDCNKDENENKNKKLDFSRANKLAEAIRQVVTKHCLDGYTIRCFDLLEICKTTGCIAVSNDNERLVAGCEGDIPALLSMKIIKDLIGVPSFMANPSRINNDAKTITFAHCTIPLSLTEDYDYDTHFESGIGVAIKGKMMTQEVTIFKLGNSLKEYKVIKGNLICNLNEKNLCRTQIVVKVNSEDLNYFLTSPLGNHHIICYGDQTKIIKEFFKICYGIN